MRFGKLWTQDAEVAPSETLPLVPDGTHVAQVKFVDFRKKERVKCDANPDGEVILVLLAVPKYEPFFVDVPCHYRGTVEALCRSASVDPPDPNADWDCRVLKDRMVTVETIHGIGKTGKDYVRVERWKTGPAPLPSVVRNAPARTPKQKADNAGHDPDDIPF